MSEAAATYNLPANAQLTFETLRIGMAGIATEDYVDEAGTPEHGLRTGLWLFFRDDPDEDCAVRVHTGQSVTRAGYGIEVLGINADPPGTVQLRLTRLLEPSSASPIESRVRPG